MSTVSVIIPVYNAAPYLRRCLDSVLGQTLADWEAVCVDDGSTDGSAAILDDYAGRDARFRVIHQPNRGTLVARKVAVAAATGAWCLFLDPDDWLEPGALARLATAVAARPEVDLVGFGVVVHATEERVQDVADAVARQLNPEPCTYGRDAFFEAVFVLHKVPGHLIGKAVRAAACKRAFGALLDRHISFQEDLCALYRVIAEIGQTELIADRLYNYCVGAGVSYRPHMTPEEFFGSFSKFEELGDLKAFRKARFPDGSSAALALERLETRMALATVSEALERLERPVDGCEGVRRLREVCSDEVVSAACAEWFRLKGERFAGIARRYGLGDLLGDVALRQLDFVWRGHNSRLRELGREIADGRDALAAVRGECAAQQGRLSGLCAELAAERAELAAVRAELAAERAARERLEEKLRHPLRTLLKGMRK